MRPHSAHQPYFQRIRTFAHEHDDVPAFHAAFLVWTFLAAAIFNTGFFGVLIGLHMLLDVAKYRDFHHFTWRRTFIATFYESFIDVTLFFVAIVSAIYLHHGFAIAVLSGLSRAQLTLLRAFALILTRMQILEHTLHIVANIHTYLRVPHPLLDKPMTITQKLCLVSLIASIMLLVLSPLIFAGRRDELFFLLANDLVPWRL